MPWAEHGVSRVTDKRGLSEVRTLPGGEDVALLPVADEPFDSHMILISGRQPALPCPMVVPASHRGDRLTVPDDPVVSFDRMATIGT